MPEYKVIVVGDSAVGKTAIIHQYINGTFSRTHTMTTGVKNQPKVVELPNKKQIQLDIWDTAGQDEYAAMNRNFFSGAHCVIIVFAID